MEYLMTYGWAILIIAIVLAALFSLGVFNGSALPTACIAQSGFSCTSAIYAHGTGNVVASIGQSTGSTWTVTNVVFLNATNLGTFQSTSNFPAVTPNAVVGTLNSGVAVAVSIPVSSATTTSVGAPISGQIWAAYKIGATTYFSEIAVLTAKAV